jgi:hypothetical protein
MGMRLEDGVMVLEDDECDGECIERPHQWRYGNEGQFFSPVCQRTGCKVMGTGDRCGDGECEGEPHWLDVEPDVA